MILLRLLLPAAYGLFMAWLSVLAGPYRALLWKTRTFPGLFGGIATWFGVLCVYPAFAADDRPVPGLEGVAVASWLALILACLVRMFLQWCFKQPRRDEARSHALAGRGEPLSMLALVLAAREAVGLGAAVFFLFGYACSIAQLILVNLRRYVGSGAFSRLMATRLAPLGDAARFLSARPVPAAVEGGGYRPPSFASRVASQIVGSLIFSFSAGLFSLWGVFKLFAFALAVPLWLAGWSLTPPEDAREEAGSAFARARAAIAGNEDLRRLAGDAGEDLERAKAEAAARLRREKEELDREAERHARRAIWGGFFP